MSDGMKKIQPLDSLGKEEFFRPASRLIEAQNKQYRSYHERPIQRDMFADYDAIAAWGTVTCCYSGIEQAMKCLLQLRGAFKRKKHWHHCIGKLFRELASEEQDVLRVSYAIYRSLHDYIPLETVDCFLNAIDDGYPSWRYFLLEGNDQSKWPPTTHPGAMLEIWSALKDILLARVFTNHGLYSVEKRIKVSLNRKLQRAPNELVDINECIDFFLNHAERKLDSDGVQDPYEKELSTLVEDVTRFVYDGTKEEWIDNDLVYFVHRAQRGELHWNSDTELFEKVSRLEKIRIKLVVTERSDVESFVLGPSVEVETIEKVPKYIEEFTFEPRLEGDYDDADWTAEIDVERVKAEYEGRMAEIEEYLGGNECEAYDCQVGRMRLIIVLYDSREWIIFEHNNRNVPGVPRHCVHIVGNLRSLREAIGAIEQWRKTQEGEVLAVHKQLWNCRGKRRTEARRS